MWNLLFAIKDRESGSITGPAINEENLKSFTQNFFGSRSLVQQIQHKEFQMKREAPISYLTFNSSGDLLCASFGDKRLILYDWEYNRMHKTFTSDSFLYGSRFKCLKSNGTEFEIILTGYERDVKHGCADSSGKITFESIFRSRASALKFTLVPRNINEIVIASLQGDIFQADVRSRLNSPNAVATVMHSNGNKLMVSDIIHHPFYLEICVYGDDRCLHVYDKRKYGTALRKIFLENKEERRARIYNCSYNFDGTKFLVQGVPYATLLLNNDDKGEIPKSFPKYDNSCFFGPKSNYIIFSEPSDTSPKISFYDTNTGELVHETPEVKEQEPTEFRISTMEPNFLLPNPKLPIIITAAGNAGISVFSPPNIVFQNWNKYRK